MLCKDLIKILENYAPPRLAMGWDNPGMQTGDLSSEVGTIMVALDATDDVVEQAVQEHVDLLVTHHPLLFRPMKKITEEDFIGRRIRKLIRNHISLYAMHTNCDIAKMADRSAQLLGLRDTEPLGDEVEVQVQGEGTGDKVKLGIGKVGILKEELSLGELCQRVKDVFGVGYVQVSGEKEAMIRRVAVCPGSGHDFIRDALGKKAQVLVTGDLGHHEVLDARAQGLFLIDAGHFGTESFMKQQLFEDLRQRNEIQREEIRILLAKEEAPFRVC